MSSVVIEVKARKKRRESERKRKETETGKIEVSLVSTHVCVKNAVSVCIVQPEHDWKKRREKANELMRVEIGVQQVAGRYASSSALYARCN